MLSYGESRTSTRPEEAFVVTRKRDPHLDVRSSVGAELNEECVLDFSRLYSVQPAQLYMKGKWEKKRRKSWKTKEDHSSQTQIPVSGGQIIGPNTRLTQTVCSATVLRRAL